MLLPPEPIHPKGEPKELSKQVAPTTLEVDTFEGKVHVEWEPGASVTPMGQLAFFIQGFKNWLSVRALGRRLSIGLQKQ